MGRSRRIVPAILVLAAALIWRLLGISRVEVWRDEALTLIDSRASWRDLLLKLPLAEDSPPAAYLLYKPWLHFFPTEQGARMLPVLLGVAAVGVLMWTAYR